MQDKAIGPVRGTSTWTAAKTRRETRCFQLLGFLFLFAKPLRARDDPGEVAQPLTPPPHACTHPRAHRRWRPPNASCCNRHRAVLLVPPAPFPPAGRRERRESFSTVAKLLFVWQRLFSSLSLSLFTFMQMFAASLFADRFQTIASCRLVPFVPLSCSVFSTQAGVLPPASWKWTPLQAGCSQQCSEARWLLRTRCPLFLLSIHALGCPFGMRTSGSVL